MVGVSMGTDYKASILENTHTVKILMILNENGKMMKGDLARSIAKGTSTVQARVAELVEAGLLTETREKVKPFKIFVSLTPEDENVANMLRAIESCLRNSGPEKGNQ